MTIRAHLKLAALGGPNTFGGDAAQLMRKLYPEFGALVFFPTEKAARDFDNNGIDAFCVPQQTARTGAHLRTQTHIARPESKLYVLAEVVHAYHCTLLVKPGSRLDQITRVLGHTGSITQSRPWLIQNLPQAEIVIVDTSSQGAAQEVASGDGTIASVGTPGMASQYGLQPAAKEIDGGSLGAYWAISPHRFFGEHPTRLVVSGRFDDRSDLSGLIDALAGQGFRLQTIYQSASGLRLYEYDYVLRFAGQGGLSGIEKALRNFPPARLAGAFEMRENGH